MSSLDHLLGQGQAVLQHGSCPRAIVDEAAWVAAGDVLAAGSLALLGLWGDAGCVHMALLDDMDGRIAVLSLACPHGRFPSIGARHAPAIRLERAINDLYGLEPEGAQDRRPWLDHGCWDTALPLAAAPQPPQPAGAYAFLSAEGEHLHQIPVGPVHAGIIEPGHFRFTASGETVVRLEERLGYVHKGIDGLMRGADLAGAARLAGRVSGDSTVAYALAFARAVEAALGVEAPQRSAWMRALMAELERLANHLGDIGAICNDASFSLMQAQCAVLREHVLRAAGTAFGHRLMRDRIVPGGVTVDLASDGWAAIKALTAFIEDRFPTLVSLYDGTTSLLDRTVATGILKPDLARRFAAGGFVGRASGRGFDARLVPGYPPYDQLSFDVPTRDDGDINARVWIRIDEVEQSLSLIDQILGQMPDGDIRLDMPPPGRGCEALALVEGFRGDVLAWVRLAADGRIERCHLRDPSWFQWPLLEAVIEGNIVADFPLCNKSFNCSYSGHDL